MLVVRKYTTTTGEQTRYSITLLWFFCLAFSYSILKGDHIEVSIGVGPIDIRFGTTIWRNWLRI